MTTRRLHALFLGFIIFAVVLVGRLFSLQVKDYGTFAAFARGQQFVFADLTPERGSILARNRTGEEVVFATMQDLPLVYAVPKDITDHEAAVNLLRDVLGLEEADAAELAERLQRADDPYEPVAERLTEEQEARIREADLAGLHVSEARTRTYPQGSRLAHVLGFIGFDDEGQKRGVYGLEAMFEGFLRGDPGKLRGERDGSGRILEAFSDRAASAVPGADIVLTIDPNVQYRTEKALGEAAEKFKVTGGSAIVVEAKTGAIVAMASVPQFDPNKYEEEENVRVYTNDAVSTPYEPGSIFKPITMAAALDTGGVTPETTFENTGTISINGYTIGNVLTQYDGKVMSMIDVLRNSLNTGAIFAMQQAGNDKFLQYLEAFGFGKKTGVELPSEAEGSIANLYTGREINYATASFGQGITATPLQMAMAIGAIANGGTRMEPHIVSEVRYPDGTSERTEPVSVGDVISSRTARQLAAMMVRVVDDGSGYATKIPGYSIAGKTGTAQIPKIGSSGYESSHIHSFVGFFPAFDAEYVILTKLDRPQGARYAEVSAVPVAREIAEYLITYAGIPPDRPVE
jgi:cell division protein FtsI/penicillin-binding protein 2